MAAIDQNMQFTMSDFNLPMPSPGLSSGSFGFDSLDSLTASPKPHMSFDNLEKLMMGELSSTVTELPGFDEPESKPDIRELSPSQIVPNSSRKQRAKRTHQEDDEEESPGRPLRQRRKRAKVQSPKHEDEDVETDDEFAKEVMMTPEEEEALRKQLQIKQRELEDCVKNLKGLSPAEKKRVRNRHASCVSRLKKKLYICGLQRQLEQYKEQTEELRAENAVLKNQLANSTSSASTPTDSPKDENLSGLDTCTCGKVARDNSISCDVCNVKFHQECMQVSTADLDMMGGHFMCPRCRK